MPDELAGELKLKAVVAEAEEAARLVDRDRETVLDTELEDDGMLERGSDDPTALDTTNEADVTEAEIEPEVRTVVKEASEEVCGKSPDWEEA